MCLFFLQYRVNRMSGIATKLCLDIQNTRKLNIFDGGGSVDSDMPLRLAGVFNKRTSVARFQIKADERIEWGEGGRTALEM